MTAVERVVSGRDEEEGLAALRGPDGGQRGQVRHREHPSHMRRGENQIYNLVRLN